MVIPKYKRVPLTQYANEEGNSGLSVYNYPPREVLRLLGIIISVNADQRLWPGLGERWQHWHTMSDRWKVQQKGIIANEAGLA